jgi:hypothetical protein
VDLSPISVADARDFIFRQGGGTPTIPPGLYACALSEAEQVRAGALVDLPPRAAGADPLALEIVCIATDGGRFALSQLYGAARRVAYGLGYVRLYRRPDGPEEIGALRGAGWRGPDGLRDGRRWSAPPP